MTDIGIRSVTKQEKSEIEKPRLLPSPGLGNWLNELGGSLIFSTYQSARVFFLSGKENGETVALERIVGSAMGLAVDRDRLWITNKEQAWRFSNVGQRRLKISEDAMEELFDAVYMPRWGLFLGPCDTHDILANTSFDGRRHELLFVNTSFSCIASIDGHYNFIPVWKPKFISALSPEDRCHLNGMGEKDGRLAYVTACAMTDEGYAWKDQKSGGGVLIDVETDEVIASGFSMPHSPRWHDGKIWMLNSGDGEFGYVDPSDGRFVQVADCPGFARGLYITGDHAVIGLSRLRENTFASGLRIKEKLESRHIPQRCGLIVVNLKTGRIDHWLTIENAISELYDVAFMNGIRRPFTPGFSHPEMHRYLINIPSDRFKIEKPAKPQKNNDAASNAYEASEEN